MKFGKIIRLFLIDGEPNGRMTCELSNWTGKAYKIPRIKVKECADRPDLSNPGVYLLFGKDESGRDLVYVGEAEIVLKRLNQQLIEKDFWNEVIVFISKDENLNKAHIKFLENSMYELAKSVNRYRIYNTIVPTKSSISEADRAEMEEYLSNVRLLVNTLGHKVFDGKREVDSSDQEAQQIFYIKGVRGTDAQGEPTSDGFVVFEGSKVSDKVVPSFTDNYKRIRNQLIVDGIIAKEGDNLIFTEDYVFSSPSTAAVMVLGRNANGLTEWKLKNGMTLKDHETIKG